MLDHAQEALQMLGDATPQDVADNRLLELALTRLVEVVGEAASHVPSDFQQAHPHIPWRQAGSMRNFLIHGYDVVRHDILCNTIRRDFPPLIERLQQVITEIGTDPIS